MSERTARAQSGQAGYVADRAHLGKLIAMLSASSPGERDNALTAFDRALRGAGLDWNWVADLVAKGEVPGPRDAIFNRLVSQKLRASLVAAWAMPAGSAELVRLVLVACEEGKAVEASQLERALDIASDAQRRAR